MVEIEKLDFFLVDTLIDIDVELLDGLVGKLPKLFFYTCL